MKKCECRKCECKNVTAITAQVQTAPAKESVNAKYAAAVNKLVFRLIFLNLSIDAEPIRQRKRRI